MSEAQSAAYDLGSAISRPRSRLSPWLGMSARGTKRTFTRLALMSAFDPKRTSPIECHAHDRSMLHDVEGILAEPTVLAEIDGKRAVTENQVQRRPKQLTSKP